MELFVISLLIIIALAISIYFKYRKIKSEDIKLALQIGFMAVLIIFAVVFCIRGAILVWQIY